MWLTRRDHGHVLDGPTPGPDPARQHHLRPGCRAGLRRAGAQAAQALADRVRRHADPEQGRPRRRRPARARLVMAGRALPPRPSPRDEPLRRAARGPLVGRPVRSGRVRHRSAQLTTTSTIARPRSARGATRPTGRCRSTRCGRPRRDSPSASTGRRASCIPSSLPSGGRCCRSSESVRRSSSATNGARGRDAPGSSPSARATVLTRTCCTSTSLPAWQRPEPTSSPDTAEDESMAESAQPTGRR